MVKKKKKKVFYSYNIFFHLSDETFCFTPFSPWLHRLKGVNILYLKRIRSTTGILSVPIKQMLTCIHTNTTI